MHSFIASEAFSMCFYGRVEKNLYGSMRTFFLLRELGPKIRISRYIELESSLEATIFIEAGIVFYSTFCFPSIDVQTFMVTINGGKNIERI